MKFVFEVRIKAGHTEDEYIEAWKNGSAIIQKQPGAQGTKLHRKIGEPGVLLAIASWESKEARDVATRNLEKVDPQTREILDKHKRYGDITVIGAFEDSFQIVDSESNLPPQAKR